MDKIVVGNRTSAPELVFQSTSFSYVFIVIRSIFLACITLGASFGNFIVSFTLHRRRYLLTPSNKLVFSLTVTNFFFSIIILPFVTVGSAQQQWLLGKVWCSLTGFIALVVLAASMFTLSVISFDRYYAIVHPLKYPTHITGYRVTCVIGFCWLVAGGCSLPPLFGAGSYFTFHYAKMACMPVWSFNRGFGIFWVFFCLILPYIVMAICYSCIFRVACKKAKQEFIQDKSFATRINTTSTNEGYVNCVEESNDIAADDTFPKEVEIRRTNPITEQISSRIDVHDSGIVSCGVMDEKLSDADPGLFSLPHQIPDELPTLMDENVMKSKTNQSWNNNGLIQRNAIGVDDRLTSSNAYCHDILPQESTSADAHANLPSMSASVVDSKSLQHHPKPELYRHMDLSQQENSSLKRSSKSLQGRSRMIVTLNKDKLKLALGRDSMRSESAANHRLERCSSRSSNWSRSSMLSRFSHHFKSFSYSHHHYYSNPKKALCTVLCIMGLLLISIGPFIACTMHEIATGTGNSSGRHSLLSDWFVSISTTIMFLTCIYYPIIYGMWNRSLRKEMRTLLCCKSRGQRTRRSRVLSLSTHLKDLSLSPRLTAAIMLESAAVATFARPMQLDQKPLRRRTSNRANSLLRMFQGRKSIHTASRCESNNMNANAEDDTNSLDLCKSSQENRKETRISPLSEPREYTMRLKTDEESQSCQRGSFNTNDNNKYRDREKPVSNVLGLSSFEILSSDVLFPALLYNDHALKNGVHFNKYKGAPKSQKHDLKPQPSKRHLESVMGGCFDENDVPCCSKTSNANTQPISACYKKKTCLPGIEPAAKSTSDRDNQVDKIAEISEGRLQSSRLVHLEAGEPIKVRKWSKPQVVEFFAQTFAYDLVEDFHRPK